jgi:ribose 5-phosphate isomerase B
LRSIAANKIPGIRAALCYTRQAALFSRRHNDANVLVLGAKFVKPKEVIAIINSFLKAKFEGGRHQRRVNQIRKMEKEFC